MLNDFFLLLNCFRSTPFGYSTFCPQPVIFVTMHKQHHSLLSEEIQAVKTIHYLGFCLTVLH